MKGFTGDIEKQTKENTDFRRVLYTGKHLQLVLMTIAVGEDIGEENHNNNDQFFRIEKGHGEIWIDGVCIIIEGGDGVLVPAGAKHNLINTGDKPLKLYTLYGPPNHQKDTTQAIKADVKKEHFDGVTTESNNASK
jgi:mannose-6-phosphate isomerase-like protein (cupin superfamily)